MMTSESDMTFSPTAIAVGLNAERGGGEQASCWMINLQAILSEASRQAEEQPVRLTDIRLAGS